jgi:alkaline phosphatase
VLDVIAGTGNPDYDDNGQLRASPLYEWIGEDVWTALKNGTFRSDDGAAWRLLQDRAEIVAAGIGDPGAERLALIAEAFAGTNFYRSGASPARRSPSPCRCSPPRRRSRNCRARR